MLMELLPQSFAAMICNWGSSSVWLCLGEEGFEKMENQSGVLLGYVRWERKEEGGEEDGVAPRVSPPGQRSRLEDVQVEMLEKARELFQLCDKDEKGFITKVDMQRLQSELPLTPEQLETVFDSLEQNNKGYLTPVEFSMGLGKLIGIELCQGAGRMDHSRHEETFESGWSDDLDPADDDDEEKRFCSMMEQLGAAQLFEDPHEIRELWARLRKERPELLSNFEEFLLRVSSYIKEVNHEKESMEQALKRKESDHDREVRCLYEEMEQQIKAERERLVCQEALRHDRSNLLQKELHNKEQELEKILYRQKKLEHQLQSLNSEQLETRVQNERLRHLNENLLEELEKSKWELEAVKGQLQKLQKEAQIEQEQKDRDVFRVSKNMQKEKQSLLRQLELLREMNKKLRDERDAFEAKKLVPQNRNALLKKGSVLGSYLLEDKPVKRLDGCLCRVHAVSPCPLRYPVSQAVSWGWFSHLGAGWLWECGGLQALEAASCSPDRIFKVVFVGNSGVGKSSFIHRFCYDRFLAELNATIGIDYQVKSLMVDNTQVALQLWDTAGQERFRSVTKQYFRKADGILVMYDITAECSFVAVRNWMSSVQEGIEDGAVVFLLGNKLDAVQRETRKVPKVEGERLAKEYKAVFYECSAMTGYNIMEPMLHMARLLTAQEDRQRENALQLEDISRRKGCCT
ncbi:hypothetical protein EK904_007970 [Melospiza melodia maxima]|nr:hypothetical protein EK904_007970 [Melospiza melodia maxima]